jgi:hypothetical protein
MLVAFEMLVESSEENKLDEFIITHKLRRTPDSVSHTTPSRIQLIVQFQTPKTCDRNLSTAFESVSKSISNSASIRTPFILKACKNPIDSSFFIFWIALSLHIYLIHLINIVHISITLCVQLVHISSTIIILKPLKLTQ